MVLHPMSRVLNNRLIWLDDERNPFNDKWVSLYSPIGTNCEIIWLKSFYEFKEEIDKNGLPDAICFDHDLSDIENPKEMTGYDCAKYLVDYCIDNNLDIPPYNIQSSNPSGKENISGLLNNYIKYRKTTS